MSLLNKRHSLLALGIFVAMMGFVLVFLYKGCSDADFTHPEASASPSAATEANRSAPPNQTNPPASQPNAGASSSDDTLVAKEISGIVKDERSGQAVTEAVVVLFNESKTGSIPQLVNHTTGQFIIVNVPLKAGVTYSLQSKAPGLCGEETFNSQLIDPQNKISRDIILKPCQNQATITQPTATGEAGFTGLSNGPAEAMSPLNSMSVWMEVLATTWSLTLIILIGATLSFLIFVRKQMVVTQRRIDELYDWMRKVDSESKKADQLNEGAMALLNLRQEISQTLQQLIGALNNIAAAVPRIGNQTTANEEEPRIYDQTPARVSPPPYQMAYSSSQEPTEWYRALSQGVATSPAPVFVEISTASSDTSPLASNRRLCFEVRPNHGSFVVRRGGDGVGWIYPNPRSNYMADHHQVFEGLDQRNFDQQVTTIAPKQVTFLDGCWQLKL